MRALPPLNALRAFDAAARLESFNQAARVLHLTPSAISHQVRSLEAFLGVALFERGARSVRLTEAGRGYHVAVSEALSGLETATERLRQRPSGQRLTLSAAPVFAMNWLIPRLADFHRCYPEIEVRLDTGLGLADFERSDVDAAIRYLARPPPAALTSHYLFRERLMVVCSPSLAERLPDPGALDDIPLLHSMGCEHGWALWNAGAGVAELDTRRGTRFANDTEALEAAMRGLGAVVIHREVVQPMLMDRRLVAPFALSVPGRLTCYLVYPRTQGERGPIAALRAWLLPQFEGADERGEA